MPGRPKKYTDEQFAAAQQLIDDGAPVGEALNSVGIPAQSWYKRKREQRDPTPGGGKGRPRAKQGVTVTDEQLVAALTKAAIAPAVPASMWLRCDYCTMHFINTGPQAAQQLVEISRTNPALRKLLENGYNYFNQGAWAALLAMYVGVPIAHHLAPDFIYKWCVLLMGMPAREAVTYAHAHADSPTNGAGPPNAEGTGYETLDDEQVMNMARQMGIDFDVEVPVTDVTDDTEGTDAATPPDAATGDTDAADAATAPAAPEAVTPDTDADKPST